MARRDREHGQKSPRLKPTTSPPPPRKTTPSAKSKALLREIPTDEEMQNVVTNLKPLGHYAVAVIGMAYIDRALVLLLKSSFIKLDKDDHNRVFDGVTGILSGSDPKIRIAYATKLISASMYHDLIIMNAMRNAFAHSLNAASFDHEEIKADCLSLKALRSARENHNITTYNAFEQPIDIFIESVVAFYMGIRDAIRAIQDNEKIRVAPYRDFFHESLRGKWP